MTGPRLHLGASVLALTHVLACAGANDAAEAEQPVTVDGTLLSYEEFLASLSRDPETGAYYVEDIVTKDAHILQTEYERRLTSSALIQDYWIQNSSALFSRVPASRQQNINYCVTSGFTTAERAIVRAALNTAAASWEANIQVNFVDATPAGGCTAGNTSVWFDVRKKTTCTPNGGCQWAFMAMPQEPRATRFLQLESALYADSNGDGVPNIDIGPLMTHELGHALGFMHEHVLAGCPEADTTFTQLTPYDSWSVMHYPNAVACGGSSSTYQISEWDADGAQCIYNETDSTCSLWHGGYGGDAVLTNGYVYRLNEANTELWRTSTSDGKHTWTRALTGRFAAIGGSPANLFAQQSTDNQLYRIFESNGALRSELVSPPAARFVATSGGLLFRLSADKQTISKWSSGTTWTKIGNAASALFGGHGSVFAVSPDGATISRWNSGTSWTSIGGPAAMITQDSAGRVYKLSTDRSAVYELSGATWTQIRGASRDLLGNGDTAYVTDPNTGHLFRYDRSGATPVWKEIVHRDTQYLIGVYPIVGTLVIDNDHDHIYSYFTR